MPPSFRVARSRSSATAGSQRIDTLVHDLVERSAQAGAIVQSELVGEAMSELRDFMFEHVYLGPQVTHEREKIRAAVRVAVQPLLRPPGADSRFDPGRRRSSRRVADHIAGMTDRFAVAAFEALAVPTAFTP